MARHRWLPQIPAHASGEVRCTLYIVLLWSKWGEGGRQTGYLSKKFNNSSFWGESFRQKRVVCNICKIKRIVIKYMKLLKSGPPPGPTNLPWAALMLVLKLIQTAFETIFIGPESDHCLPLSLTNSLTDSLLFSKPDWCNPGVWRCQLKTCWSCNCCWWGSCWQQFVAHLEAEVWSKS